MWVFRHSDGWLSSAHFVSGIQLFFPSPPVFLVGMNLHNSYFGVAINDALYPSHKINPGTKPVDDTQTRLCVFNNGHYVSPRKGIHSLIDDRRVSSASALRWDKVSAANYSLELPTSCFRGKGFTV